MYLFIAKDFSQLLDSQALKGNEGLSDTISILQPMFKYADKQSMGYIPVILVFRVRAGNNIEHRDMATKKKTAHVFSNILQHVEEFLLSSSEFNHKRAIPELIIEDDDECSIVFNVAKGR